MSEVKDAAKDGFTPSGTTDAREIASLQDAAKLTMSIAWLEAMLNNGCVSEENIAAGLVERTDGTGTPAAVLYYDETGRLRLAEPSQATFAWLRSQGEGGLDWSEVHQAIGSGLGW